MKIDVEIVEDFLSTLTETEAGAVEWPEYQALLDAIDAAYEDSQPMIERMRIPKEEK